MNLHAPIEAPMTAVPVPVSELQELFCPSYNVRNSLGQCVPAGDTFMQELNVRNSLGQSVPDGDTWMMLVLV